MKTAPKVNNKKKAIRFYMKEDSSLYGRSCSCNFPNEGWVVVSNLNVTCLQTRYRRLVLGLLEA
jgi:hypothetical protein